MACAPSGAQAVYESLVCGGGGHGSKGLDLQTTLNQSRHNRSPRPGTGRCRPVPAGRETLPGWTSPAASAAPAVAAVAIAVAAVRAAAAAGTRHAARRAAVRAVRSAAAALGVRGVVTALGALRMGGPPRGRDLALAAHE